MGLIATGIGRVTAFVIPLGVWADGRVVGGYRLCLVKWHSIWGDKFYQVYVNGKFAGATVNCEQRQIVVCVPSSFETAMRIEVFAVEPEEAGVDFSEALESYGGSGRVRICLLRSQHLPVGAMFEVYFDNGTGEIDYDNPLTVEPVSVWPCWQDKAGYGLSRFGMSDFGRDWSAGVGFGRGSFGMDEFGVDTDAIEWVSEPLEAGAYRFAVKVRDEGGNESEYVETGEVTVVPAARPAETVSVSSFDKDANQLVLSVV